jgi:hypothetical protein
MLSSITDRDRPTHDGKPLKKEQNKFPTPYENNSFEIFSMFSLKFIYRLKNIC